MSSNRSESRAPQPSRQSNALISRGIGYLILASTLIFLLSPAPNSHPGGVNEGAEPSSSRGESDPRARTRKLPVRVQSLLAQSQIVGRHLGEVKEGTKTVQEIIHGESGLGAGIGSSVHIGMGDIARNHRSAPMNVREVLDFLQSFLKKLNSSNIKNKRATFHGIWAAYHELVVKWLYPWDQEVSFGTSLHVVSSMCALLPQHVCLSEWTLLFSVVLDPNASTERRR